MYKSIRKRKISYFMCRIMKGTYKRRGRRRMRRRREEEESSNNNSGINKEDLEKKPRRHNIWLEIN
jgi:hypothetical protein